MPTVVQVLDGDPAGEHRAGPGGYHSREPAGATPAAATTIMQLALMDVTGAAVRGADGAAGAGPAGMAPSTYEQPLPEARAAEAARGHRPDGTMLHGRWHTYPEQAAAGLWTTPTDLAKWALAIDAARRGERDAILSQATATEMLTVQKGPSARALHRRQRPGLHFGHGGANEGFRAPVIFFPATGQGAAVMSNNDCGRGPEPGDSLRDRRGVPVARVWTEAGAVVTLDERGAGPICGRLRRELSRSSRFR